MKQLNFLRSDICAIMGLPILAMTCFINLHDKTWAAAGSNLVSIALRKTVTHRVCHCAIVISRFSTTVGTGSWARLAINDTSSAECYEVSTCDLKYNAEILRNWGDAVYRTSHRKHFHMSSDPVHEYKTM